MNFELCFNDLIYSAELVQLKILVLYIYIAYIYNYIVM